jgi:hypothetical protein
MGFWIVEAKNGALRGVRSELPGDRLSLPAVRLHLEVLGRPTELARQKVEPAQGTRGRESMACRVVAPLLDCL